MERTIKPEMLKAALADKHLIDVRRKADLDASSEQIPGATWHNPENLAEWAKNLPRDKHVVLYCVRGGSVSNGVRTPCMPKVSTHVISKTASRAGNRPVAR